MSDFSFVTNEHAIQYIKDLENSNLLYDNDNEKISDKIIFFKENLQSENKEICDIMVNFLSLNPFFRMTAYECLTQCKVFN